MPESSSPDGKTLLFAVSKKIRAYSLALHHGEMIGQGGFFELRAGVLGWG